MEVLVQLKNTRNGLLTSFIPNFDSLIALTDGICFYVYQPPFSDCKSHEISSLKWFISILSA